METSNKTNVSRRDFLIKALMGVGCLSTASACRTLGLCEYSGIKLGVFDATLPKGNTKDPKALYLAKSLLLDGVQVSSSSKEYGQEFFSKELLERYKFAMKETGMEISSVAPTGFNGAPFIASDNAVNFLKSSIDAASELNTRALLLPFYGAARLNENGKPIKEEFVKPLIERLKAVAPYAEEKGVVVCMENSISADDNKRIIDAVGSEYIKVYYDTFNFQYYGFPSVDAIYALKGYIGQVHVKTKEHDFSLKTTIPEEGMEACIQAFIDIGYKDWIVLETHGFKKDPKAIVDLIGKNVAYLRKSKLFA